MKFSPRGPQPQMIDFLTRVPRGNLWGPMGVGKTVTTLTAVELLQTFVGEDRPTLVLGPKRVVRDVWGPEAQQWDHLKHLDVSTILGTQEERRAALRRPANVFVMNYENLLWLADELEGKPWPFARVIPDEATKLKSFRITQGGARAQVLGAIAHKHCSGWWNLTGTPSPNGLMDLWGQQWFVDKGQRLCESFTAFKQRWFQPTQHSDGRTSWVATPFADRQIRERLADCTLAFQAKDWFPLKDPIVSTIRVDLPPSARRHYRELEREYFTSVAGTEIEAFTAAAKSLKLAQCASGAIYLDAERYGLDAGEQKAIEVHESKLEALESLLEEWPDENVLVTYNFKSSAKRLQRAFPHAKLLGDGAVDDWNAGKVKLLLAHPASAGHGLSLQHGGRVIVHFDGTWNLEHHDQVNERLGPMRQLQGGYDRHVYVYYIAARGTIDDQMQERLISKRALQDSLVEYMSEASKRV